MKKLCIILIVLVSCGTLFAQQPTELQKARQEINRLNIVLDDVKADRYKLTVANDQLTKNAIAINDGIKKATKLLQRGYENGKLDYEVLRKMGFVLAIDSTNVYQRPKPNKADPKK